jgi:hypothetical protein
LSRPQPGGGAHRNHVTSELKDFAMSTSVINAYSKDYGAQVHAAYQRQGTKLRNTVRTRNNVTGAIAVFQKVGKGSASTKARHGKVPVMNASCTIITAATGSTNWTS